MNSQIRSNFSRSLYESENNSQYNEYLQGKIEALSRAWLHIDKSFDSEVDQQELLDFLDSQMNIGKKFDRGVAKEIFKLMDLDTSGKITVEEFIKRYISIEDEIRRDIRDYQKIFYTEKEKNGQLYKMMMQHKNESVNEKGVGQNAKIILQISSIEFFKQIQGKLEKISIRLKLDNQIAETAVVAFENKLFYKESFEFNVGTGENLIIEILNHGQNNRITSVGKVFFSLSSISAEDEYDLELVIPEFENQNSNLAKVTGSFHFILSMFKYYRDLYTESENLLKEYQTNLNKRNFFLDTMNEPLKSYNNKYDNISRVKGIEGDSISKGNLKDSNEKLSSRYTVEKGNLARAGNHTTAEDNTGVNLGNLAILNKFGAPTASDFQMADKIETFVKNTFNKPNIQWMGLIKFFLIILILLSFVNLLDRSDFINFVLQITILLIFYTSLNNNVVGYLNLFIVAIAGSLIYDVLWFFLSASVHFIGFSDSSSLKIFVVFNSLILFFAKICLGISIWVQRLKYQRTSNGNKNNIQNVV